MEAAPPLKALPWLLRIQQVVLGDWQVYAWSYSTYRRVGQALQVSEMTVYRWVSRFTPFSRDARPEIRGKSPLQLAGYDLSRIPMSCLCRGYSLEWHLIVESGDVPNS